MTVKSIIGECLIKMGLQDFTDKSPYSESEHELLIALLNAIDIAYREVVCEYLPLTTEEKVTFEDKQLAIKGLSKTILYPIRITCGENVKSFKAYPNRIVADIDGDAMLEYAYIPEPLMLSSRIDNMRLTQSALTDGALAEYYFANKVFDLAKSFDTSFRSKMGLLRYKGKRLRLKERGWNS